MNITLFGATGRVGSTILREIEKEHQVTVLVRDASKLLSTTSLKIIEGSILDERLVEEAIENADMVISAIGTDKTTTLEESIGYITNAMKEHGVNRIITIGTAGILQSRTEPSLLRYQSSESKRRLTFAAEQHEKVFRTLEQSSLEWTIVCPTYLPDGNAKGNYRVEKDFLPEGATEITVGDTAGFACTLLQSNAFNRSRVGIGY
ncbi:NAD(P)-dependent oxidoreductase [Paenisporosarcina cavernae]|uniref:NAD-dependent epimerase/dehydratase family protein n=1 Tax=Paenisporosarcina cavernae TaxID=2320858 RepID=A0A385YUT7_9BACL|nr:NAD(P)H-binding protein [Paenisporosarcina cavernae]AYC30655.1 NAD-dependent epimerase/dehydratase family protein [Paenisporosarcina cavernae]